MRLGILVNTDLHAEDIEGLAMAALSKGHTVNIFMMDTGTRLLMSPSIVGLCRLNGVRMSYCGLNAKNEGIDASMLPEEITCGSQYDNSCMVHESDKVIVM